MRGVTFSPKAKRTQLVNKIKLLIRGCVYTAHTQVYFINKFAQMFLPYKFLMRNKTDTNKTIAAHIQQSTDSKMNMDGLTHINWPGKIWQ